MNRQQRTLREKLRRAQSGQAIVFIALLMVSLIGMLGLAIDGGRLFLLRQDVSNAADASVLAASYAICAGGDPVQSALAAASRNGYTNDVDPNTVNVEYPPTSGPRAGDDNYVSVNISATIASHFIHIVYPGPLGVTLESVGYCREATNTADLGGINALGTCGCESGTEEVRFTGSDFVMNGGISSNGCAGFSNGSGVYNMVDNPINVLSPGTVDGGSKIDWYSTSNANDPTDTTAWSNESSANTGNLSSKLNDPLGWRVMDFHSTGEYGAAVIANCPTTQCWFTDTDYDYTKGQKNLQEGIHWSSGDITIFSSDTFVDTDGDGSYEYTFVTDGQIGSNGVGAFRAPDDADPSTVDWLTYYTEGVIAFSGKTSKCTKSQPGISLSGAGYVKGVFYAPASHVSYSASEIYFWGAIIGYTVTGSMSDGTYIYDPTLIPPQPPAISIAQ